jgi:hypothetical protein
MCPSCKHFAFIFAGNTFDWCSRNWKDTACKGKLIFFVLFLIGKKLPTWIEIDSDWHNLAILRLVPCILLLVQRHGV